MPSVRTLLLCLTSVCWLLACAPTMAAQRAGVPFDDTVSTDAGPMVFNGAGIRRKFVFKVYVAALYVPHATRTAATLLDSPGPCRLHMHLLRNVDADTLVASLNEGLAANSAAAELAAIRSAAIRFATLLREGGELRVSETLILAFAAGGVSLSRTGKPLGNIADARFARALLRVWLGDAPAVADLKNALLGL